MSIETAIASRLGVQLDHEPLTASLSTTPHLLRDGLLRPCPLVLMVDMLAGVAAEATAGGDWVFTTDLSLRLPRADVPSEITGDVAPLRIGRGSVTNEVRMLADGQEYAYGQAGFIRLPRRHGDPAKPHLNLIATRIVSVIDQPLVDAAGIDVVDAASGRVEVTLVDELRNPAGAMQGAMVSLTAEVAVEAMAAAHLDGPHRITDIDLRYLAMGRVGPVRSHASWIGDPRHGSVRVELRDHGSDDRLMTAVLARVAPVH